MIQPLNNHDYILKGSELPRTSENQSETYNRTSSISTTASEATIIKRNQSWSSFDNPHEYLVAKCESNRELAAKFAPDAATQTDEQRLPEHVISTEESNSSSSEVIDGVNGSMGGENEHGRMKMSRVFMQLITCGADSVTDVSPVNLS
ncbi:hypothetical protein Hanom_Chr08g00715681 [Helianthus anomalus]